MSELHKLLIVEDEPDYLDLYCEYLNSEEYDLTTARTISQAFALLEQNEFEVVVTDLKMIGFGNEYGGFDVLDKVKKINPSTKVIVITAYGAEDIAFKTMQHGASNIVYKTPDHLERLKMIVRNAIELKSFLAHRKQKKTNKIALAESSDLPAQQSTSLFGILGNSRMMRQAFEKISYAAHMDQSVFIFGEKGTGKSYVSKTIHANSIRKSRPFSKLIYSDLSSHWDVVNNNVKRMPGGTFFVDNLFAMQESDAKVLAELFELTEKSNVRLICSLTTKVSDISLIYKSSGLPLPVLNKMMSIPIFMPPLRLRRDGDDIPTLVGNYIHGKSEDVAGNNRITISSKAMEKLIAMDYKNENIIELHELLARALDLAGLGNEILEEHIFTANESAPISEETEDKAHFVFLSYSTEDSVIVDQLQKDLEAYGIKIWRDRDKLFPGMRWKPAIRKAVKDGTIFIACFSKSSEDRSRSYMHEELNQAIEELRMRPKDRAWFIPVKLNECEIPDWDIGGGESFSDIQYLELFRDWEKSIVTLVSVIKNANQKN
jgi:DNA-binding NtrC family response regulator